MGRHWGAIPNLIRHRPCFVSARTAHASTVVARHPGRTVRTAAHVADRGAGARDDAVSVTFDVASRRVVARDGAARSKLELAVRRIAAGAYGSPTSLELALRRSATGDSASVAAIAFAFGGVSAVDDGRPGAHCVALRCRLADEGASRRSARRLAVRPCRAGADVVAGTRAPRAGAAHRRWRRIVAPARTNRNDRRDDCNEQRAMCVATHGPLPFTRNRPSHGF